MANGANVTDAGTSITGFAASIAFGDNAVGRNAYKLATVAAGTWTLSFYVQMDDGTLPFCGPISAGIDFGIMFDQSFLPNAVVTITPVPGIAGLYRCQTANVAAGVPNRYFGVVKYPGMSTKGFRVSGYMLESGSVATPYIKNTTAAAVTVTDGDTRILVKPDNGNEIALRPGQRFRLPKDQGKASSWMFRSFDGYSAISGAIIIGSGEFDDANTLNTFKLDGTFTNTVKVNNTVAERVPVTLDVSQLLKLDTSQLLKLDPSTIINVAGNTVQYTNSFVDASNANVAAQIIFTPAQNPNGAYLELAEVAIVPTGSAGYMQVALLAKNGPPANATDGDVLFMAASDGVFSSSGGARTTNLTQSVRIKIPAGKGLYLNQSGNTAPQSCSKTVLYTLL